MREASSVGSCVAVVLTVLGALTGCASQPGVAIDGPHAKPAPDAPAPTAARPQVVELALTWERSCARTATGVVVCWGLGWDGVVRTWPSTVAGLTDVEQLAIGPTHGCARTRAGRLRCFGGNEAGALGNGTHEATAVPSADPGLDGVLEVAVGDDFTCARTPQGVSCWGDDRAGALAGGSLGTEALRPRPAPLLAGAERLALAGRHGFALLHDGGVIGWGDDGHRLLGPTPSPKPSPVSIAGLSHVRAIATGRAHACAIVDGDGLEGGRVACWGQNDAGQIGDGTTERRFAPVQIEGLRHARKLALGDRSTCALLASGRVSCWGANDLGQLGDGTTIARSKPTMVPGLVDATDVAMGGTHACAALADGTVQCWGSNASGELGDHGRSPRGVRGPVLF